MSSEVEPLTAEVVEARLARLRALYVPMTAEEARARMEPPAPAVDMSAQGVQARLDELSALLRLTNWLQGHGQSQG